MNLKLKVGRNLHSEKERQTDRERQSELVSNWILTSCQLHKVT